MQLNSLKLINFRNYDNLYIDFNKKVNLLVGKNGQGKTNIVESIYMLSFGKSFRTSKDKEIIKFDTESLYVGGSYTKYDTNSLIEVAIGKNKKGIKVNKIHIQKIQELLGNLNVVIFSPEDLRLVKDGPRERRSFIYVWSCFSFASSCFMPINALLYSSLFDSNLRINTYY